MEPVERCPGQLAAANPVHRRRVSGAPRIGQLRPIHVDALGLAELPAFTDDRTAPIHDSSEHIEYEGLYAFHMAIVASRLVRNTASHQTGKCALAAAGCGSRPPADRPGPASLNPGN